MADVQKKRRTFKKYTYRGVELDKLLDMSTEEVTNMMNSRKRRSFARGTPKKHTNLLNKLRKAKKNCKELEKPAIVKTHCRNMVIIPEMVGNICGVYNGKTFIQVEIKPEMIGHYLAEFSISYRPVAHGRPGIGATNSSRFIPLK